ncbi:MAG: hypothetical protein FJW80_03310 [Actinobacteria bacterium]|nr:hypothetical protein [Actinomycetota bacterium]
MKTSRIVVISAAGVLGVAVLAGGAAAAAATMVALGQHGQPPVGSPTDDRRPERPGMGDPGPGRGCHGPGRGRPGPGRGRPGRPGGDVLHGELVVERPDGPVVTLRLQEGQATAVSATSITVASTDGFTATYAITAATEQERGRAEDTPAQVGDEVHVRATVEGTAVTAEDIHAMPPRD